MIRSFMEKRYIFLIMAGVFILSGRLILYAQSDWNEPKLQDDPDFGSYIESGFSIREDDFSEETYESFLQLYQPPVNLNVADRDDLQSLFFLNDQEISQILNHRREYGSFLSLQELFLIEGLDSATIALIKEFLTVEPVRGGPLDSLSFLKRIKQSAQYSLILRYGRILEKKKGFDNRSDPEQLLNKKYYAGSPDHLFLRFTLEVPEDFKAGLTAEKDAGETIYFSMKERAFGLDHYSGYMQKKYHSWLKHVILGDFTIHAGQGLVLGNGLFIGKGTEPIRTTVSYGQGARPYQGATEYGFFRGLALGFGGKKWEGTTFVSQKGVDASVEMPAGNAFTSVIRSIQKTGYHRTPAEIIKKNAASIRSAGILLQYQQGARNFIMGMSGVWNNLNLPLQKARNYYNIYDFSGRQLLNAGIHYNFYRGKFNVFGELALSNFSGWGVVQGLIANLGPAIETVIHLRHYGRDYFSFNARSFGEYAIAQNEKGIYWGIILHLLARLDVHFYFDIFRSNGLRYATASPSSGYEWMTCLKYNLGRFAGLDLYYQEEQKMRNLPVDTGKEYMVSPGLMRKTRLTYQYVPETGILLKSRIQASYYRFTPERNFGFAVIQDIGYKFARGYLKGRISYFKTDDFLTRQYVYEPDLLYSFSVPAYDGHGLRYSILFKITPTRNLDFWVKFGQYQFFDREIIGTGLEEIAGHKKSEIRCQIRIKF